MRWLAWKMFCDSGWKKQAWLWIDRSFSEQGHEGPISAVEKSKKAFPYDRNSIQYLKPLFSLNADRECRQGVERKITTNKIIAIVGKNFGKLFKGIRATSRIIPRAIYFFLPPWPYGNEFSIMATWGVVQKMGSRWFSPNLFPFKIIVSYKMRYS